MLVQPESNDLSSLWKNCVKEAEAAGLKMIPEVHIGLAIITMDTSVHCNPAAKLQVLKSNTKAWCADSAADNYSANGHALLAAETQFGKTQKKITQGPTPRNFTASGSDNNSRKVEETFVVPTPGTKYQLSVNKSANSQISGYGIIFVLG